MESELGVALFERQRRGVRGSEYAWANARRLEAALQEARAEETTALDVKV